MNSPILFSNTFNSYFCTTYIFFRIVAICPAEASILVLHPPRQFPRQTPRQRLRHMPGEEAKVTGGLGKPRLKDWRARLSSSTGKRCYQSLCRGICRAKGGTKTNQRAGNLSLIPFHNQKLYLADAH